MNLPMIYRLANIHKSCPFGSGHRKFARCNVVMFSSFLKKKLQMVVWSCTSKKLAWFYTLIFWIQNDFGLSKSFWSSTNHFWRVNLFWLGPNHFGQVQIIKIIPEKSNLNLTQMIWTQPKQFAPDQNNLYPSKYIWTVQNDFGLI